MFKDFSLWKAVGVFMAFLSLIAGIGGAAVFILNKGIEIGELRVKNQILIAKNESLSQSQREIANAFKALQHVEDQIRSESDNFPARPVIVRQLARMRANAQN